MLEALKGRNGTTFRRFGMAISWHEESGILRAAYGVFKTFAQELGLSPGLLCSVEIRITLPRCKLVQLSKH